MALSLIKMEKEVPGARYFSVAQFAPAANDYATPGYPVTLGMFGFVDVLSWVIPIQSMPGYQVIYDPVNVTLRVYYSAAAAGALQEVPNGTDLSAMTIQVLGKGC